MFMSLAVPVILELVKGSIRYFMKKAENKFSEEKQGETKKAYVLKEIDGFFEANPELKAKFDEIPDTAADLVEQLVKEHINK